MSDPKVASLVERRPPVPDPWTPVTMLEEFLAEIRSGRIAPVNIALHYCERNAEGALQPRVWVMNMTHAEQIALAAIMQQKAIEEWRS